MPTKMAGNTGTTLSPEAGSSTVRLQRNLAEKQRRDKLNGFISELATIVPMVSMASKRLDKTSILRLSAAHLRICQSSLNGGSSKRSKRSFKWCPSFLNSEQIREILDAVDGFLMVTTPNGKIIYISQTVENFLGHQNIEMIGHSVFSFVHPSDVDTVRSQLQEINGIENGGSGASRCSFYCRMRERNQPRSEVLTYQFVHVVGHMTVVNESKEVENGDDEAPTTCMLKAFVRVVHSNPYNELSLADAIEDEYVTRHSLDGTIIFADHRLSTITGHLPHEVYGMSAYEYIINDDIPIALFAHQLMFSNNNGNGLIVYRLRTRDDGFVYLKSTGFLQFERSSTQVDHFVCVNRQLSNSVGDRELKDFIDRFTPHINGDSAKTLLESIKAVQKTGLSIPPSPSPKIETTINGAGMDPSLSLLSSSFRNGTLKPELQGHSIRSEPKHKSKGNKAPAGNSSEKIQGLLGAYSKRVQEKMSLEESNTNCNHSPLTESSHSANSPPSDDTLSPCNPIEGMDEVLPHTDDCSIMELPGAMSKDDSIIMLDQEDSGAKGLFDDTNSLIDAESASLFQPDESLPLLSSSVLLIEMQDSSSLSCFDMSSGSKTQLSSSEVALSYATTHSDSMLSSISDPSDKGSDIC